MLEIELTPYPPQVRACELPPHRDGKLSGDEKPLGGLTNNEYAVPAVTEGKNCSRGALVATRGDCWLGRASCLPSRPGKCALVPRTQPGRHITLSPQCPAATCRALWLADISSVPAADSARRWLESHQPPEPLEPLPPEPLEPLPPEVDDAALAPSSLPVGVIAHHIPPEASRPFPLIWPDAVSPV